MTQRGMRTRQELIWKKKTKTIQSECFPMQKNKQNMLYSANRKNEHPSVQTKRGGQKDGAFEREKGGLVFKPCSCKMNENCHMFLRFTFTKLGESNEKEFPHHDRSRAAIRVGHWIHPSLREHSVLKTLLGNQL